MLNNVEQCTTMVTFFLGGGGASHSNLLINIPEKKPDIEEEKKANT